MNPGAVKRPRDGTPLLARASCPPQDGLLRELLEATSEQGVEVRFEVDGGSMRPLIRAHDVVHLRTEVTSPPRVGEVVAARGPDQKGVLVHRVVARKGERWLLRGDNCKSADGLCGAEDLIGIVARVEREGRSVWFGEGRLGWLVALVVRAGLLWRSDRVYYGARRVGRRCLKFRGADSRLPEHKGDDGNK